MRGPVVLICTLIAIAAAGEPTPDSQPPRTGVPMPEFLLFDLGQRPVRLADLQQPVVVLNFFAFWCDTWIAQLPQLRELVAQQEEMGFQFLSINVDGAWTDQLEEVCGQEGVPFPVLVDRGSRLSRELGLRHIPTILVLNSQRTIRFAYERYPGNLVVLQGIRAAMSARPSDPAQ